MKISIPKELEKHILFNYISFDRVVLRGYIQGLFVEGSVIKMLRNLGFTKHSNAVLRLLTDQLNSHIKKTAQKNSIEIHWWGAEEKKTYHSKIDLIQAKYKPELSKKNKKSKIIAIIRAVENVRTFANKEITIKSGKKFTKMYAVNKFVSE